MKNKYLKEEVIVNRTASNTNLYTSSEICLEESSVMTLERIGVQEYWSVHKDYLQAQVMSSQQSGVQEKVAGGLHSA